MPTLRDIFRFLEGVGFVVFNHLFCLFELTGSFKILSMYCKRKFLNLPYVPMYFLILITSLTSSIVTYPKEFELKPNPQPPQSPKSDPYYNGT